MLIVLKLSLKLIRLRNFSILRTKLFIIYIQEKTKDNILKLGFMKLALPSEAEAGHVSSSLGEILSSDFMKAKSENF